MSSRNLNSKQRSGNRSHVAFIRSPIVAAENGPSRTEAADADGVEAAQPLQQQKKSGASSSSVHEAASVDLLGTKKLHCTSSFTSSANFSLSSGALLTGSKRNSAGENVTPVLNTPLGGPGPLSTESSGNYYAGSDNQNVPLTLSDGRSNGYYYITNGAPAELRDDYLEAERNAFHRVPPIPRLPNALTNTFSRGVVNSNDPQLSRCLSLDESEQANSPKTVNTYSLTGSPHNSVVNSPHSPKQSSTTQRLRGPPPVSGVQPLRKGDASELIILHEQENSASVSSCKENHTYPGLGGQNFAAVCAHPSSSFVSEQQLAGSFDNNRSEHNSAAGPYMANNNSDDKATAKRRDSSSSVRRANQKYFSYITKKQTVTTSEFWRLGSFFFQGPLLDAITHACAASFFVIARAKKQFKLLGYLSGSVSKRNSMDYSCSLNAGPAEGHAATDAFLAGSTSLGSDSTASNSTCSINLSDGLPFLLYGTSLKDCARDDHYRAYFPPFLLLGARLCYVDERGYVVGTFSPSDEAMRSGALRERTSLVFVFLLFASDMLNHLPQFPPELLCTTTPSGEIVSQPPADVFTPEKLEAGHVFDTKTPYKTQWMVVSLLRFAAMMQRWGKTPAEVTASYLAVRSPHRPAPLPEEATAAPAAKPSQSPSNGNAPPVPRKPSSPSPASCPSGPEQNASLASFPSFHSEQHQPPNEHPYAKGGVPVRSNAAMDLRHLVNHQYDIHRPVSQNSPINRTRDSGISRTLSSVQNSFQVDGPRGKGNNTSGADGRPSSAAAPHPYDIQRRGMMMMTAAMRPGSAQPKPSRKFDRRLTDIARRSADTQEKKGSDFFSLWRRQEAELQWVRTSETPLSPNSPASGEVGSPPNEQPSRLPIAVPAPPASPPSVVRDGRRRSSQGGAAVAGGPPIDPVNYSATTAAALESTQASYGAAGVNASHDDSRRIPAVEEEGTHQSDTEGSYSISATVTAPPSSRSFSEAIREATERNKEPSAIQTKDWSHVAAAPTQTSLTSWSFRPTDSSADAPKGAPIFSASINAPDTVLIGLDDDHQQQQQQQLAGAGGEGGGTAAGVEASTDQLRPTRPGHKKLSVTPTLDSADLRVQSTSPFSSRYSSELPAPLLEYKSSLVEGGGVRSGLATTVDDDASAHTGFFSHISSPMKRDMQTPNSASLSGHRPLSSVGSELGSVVSSRKKGSYMRLTGGVAANVGLPHITALTLHAVVIIQAVGRGFIQRKRVAAMPPKKEKKKKVKKGKKAAMKEQTEQQQQQYQPQKPPPQQAPTHTSAKAAAHTSKHKTQAPSAATPAPPPFRPSLQLSSPPDLEDSLPSTTGLPPKEAEKPPQRRRSNIGEKRPPPLTAFSAPVAREDRLVRICAPSDDDSESQYRASRNINSPNSVSETICFATSSTTHPAALVSRVRSFNMAPLSAIEFSVKDSAKVSTPATTAAEDSLKKQLVSKSSGTTQNVSFSTSNILGDEFSSVRSGLIGASGTLAFMDTWRSKQRSDAERSLSLIAMLPERACHLILRVLRGFQARCEVAALYREKNDEKLLDAQLFKIMTTRSTVAGPKPPQPPIVQMPIPTRKVSFSVPSIAASEPSAGSRSNRNLDSGLIPWERRGTGGLVESEVFDQPQRANTPVGNAYPARRLSAKEVLRASFPTTPLARGGSPHRSPSTSNSFERVSLTNRDATSPPTIGKGFNLGPHRVSTPGGRHFFPTSPTSARPSDSTQGLQVAAAAAATTAAALAKGKEAICADPATTSPEGSEASPPHLSPLPADNLDTSRDGDTPQDSQVAPGRRTAAAGATFTPLELSLGNMYSQSTRSMGSAYSIPFNMSTTSRSNFGADIFTSSYEFSMGVSIGEQWMLDGVEVVDTDEDDFYDEHHSESSSDDDEDTVAAAAAAAAGGGAADSNQVEANRAFGDELQAIGAADDDPMVDAAMLLGRDTKALTQVDAVALIQRVGRGYLCRMEESLSLLCKLFRPDIELIARVAQGFLERKRLSVRFRVFSKVKQDLHYWELRNNNAIKIQRIIRSFVTRQKYLRLQRKLQTRLELRIATEQLEDSDDDI